MNKSLGVSFGASTIKIVEIIGIAEEIKINKISIVPHHGRPLEVYKSSLANFDGAAEFAVVTGRKFKEDLQNFFITEPEAIENALELLYPKRYFQGLLSLGSENFIFYVLNDNNQIIDVRTGNKCASGTGSFFLQQIDRMNLTLEQALRNPRISDPYYVSGRCAVFCKSDCTHALNKGISHHRIVSGLSHMIANKVFNLIGKMKRENFVVVGGVAKNNLVVEVLRNNIKNLEIPDSADYFEALGAAFYALKNKISSQNLILNKKKSSSFSFLPPIKRNQHLVSFKDFEKIQGKPGDDCILGLDVGSTTTKAILMRTSDLRIIDSVYLRTNGNPVEASRACYRKLSFQPVKILGVGVTGSGRYISALHASTNGIINEIISHATAAAFFDPEVDTIFEIGGQDAKYTYLVNGVPSEYAMNEACSAGTGSFLEEAAKESLKIDYLQIARLALSADRAPNFSDQCAAFVSSDIKSAFQENLSKEEILAGLVYSICFNYLNKVKVNRPVGKKIFMQGGVCYNQAVPLAMANILGKPLVIPPEPGLMGALGVALEIWNKIKLGLLEIQYFDLNELADREVTYGKSFHCRGEEGKCDRNCNINMIKVKDQSYPFGGVCDKYYNFSGKKNRANGLNLVKERQNSVYQKKENNCSKNITIGILRSFLTNTFFPLYYNFFTELGFKVVLSDTVDSEGIRRISSSLCYPAEIAHGYLMDLIKKNVDYVFLPHLVELYLEKSISYQKEYQSTCFLLQSEPYFLRSAFAEYQDKFLIPVLDFYKGWETQEKVFLDLAKKLKVEKKLAKKAFRLALSRQKDFFAQRKMQGENALENLGENEIAIVIFGRSYNAFADEANMGIPEKFASRGYTVIPFDYLPFENAACVYKSCWASGQEILKASDYVAKHARLFGVFITNFSCGPDSFLVTYFRDIMGAKPSLTLELDSHTSDAGINTRVEAFLDIVERSLKLGNEKKQVLTHKKSEIIFDRGKAHFYTPEGEKYSLRNQKIKVIFPSMGKLSSEIIAAVFKGWGIRAEALPVSDFSVLALGRTQTSCKECLPLTLCCGSLLKYLEKREDTRELTVFFMPTTSGNCRFTQYSVFLNRLIEKNALERLALLTLNSENGYREFGIKSNINLMQAVVVADVMDDLKNSLSVLACDEGQAEEIFNKEWSKIIYSFENGAKDLYSILQGIAQRLGSIPCKGKLSEAKIVSILGEIFVRKDDFSCGPLIKRLNKKSIIAKRASVTEWLYYVDYLIQRNLLGQKMNLLDYLGFYAKRNVQFYLEKKIKKILFSSGLIAYELIDIERLIKIGKRFVNLELAGEPILVFGSFFNEIIDHVHGVVSIGPFACLPSRVIESILTQEATIKNKIIIDRGRDFLNFSGNYQLPFIALEVDGNPFSQIIESRIEAFCLQVERLSKNIRNTHNASGSRKAGSIENYL